MARRKKQQGKAPSRRASGRLRDAFVPQAQGDARLTLYPQSLASSSQQHLASNKPHFSLRDEALNTECHQSYWSSDMKLRHNRVHFVSASAASPVEEPSEEIAEDGHSSFSTIGGEISQSSHALAHLNLQPTAESVSSSMDDDVKIILEKHDDGAAVSEADHAVLSFVVDTVGCAASTVPRLPPPVIRSPSSNPSLLSSEDEVVFKGRSSVKKIDDPVRTRTSGAPAAPSGQIEEGGHAVPAWDDTPVPWVSRSIPGVGWLDKAGRDKKSKKHRTARMVEEDEVVADYLANIREQEGYDALHSLNGQSVFHRRDLSLADGDAWTDESDASIPGTTHQSGDQDGWNPLMLEDFDNLSTSQEMSGIIERILSKRDRQHGPQYLVVYEGLTVDDAKWIPGVLMISPNDIELIKSFEETLVREYRDISDSEDESVEDDVDGSDDEGDGDGLESLLDEDDLIRRRIDEMTDEKIARLLAKQEELGLGSDELLMFDADDGNDVDEDENDQAELTLNALLRPSYRNKQKRRRLRGEFPSATLFADVLEQDPYNGFDIMDHERPSLKRKSKGRRGQLPFELSDEELQESLQSTWEADRRKKRVRKQEREELRAQGLLGRRNKFKSDPQARYKEGMTLGQIREEIQQFLFSTHESHALPPMDKKNRKVVHEIASAFNLKSKSVGSGKSRFPTLIKTSRTKDFDDRVFTTLEKRLMRSFFPRLDARGMKSAAGSPHNRGGANSAAVRYRDGDVVGGAAPEIGADNRGRAMLERMGWSSGTALGALNNKGILQPVTHVVKTSKTGLG